MRPTVIARRHPRLTGLAIVFLVACTVSGGIFGASRIEPVYQSAGIVLVIPPGAGNADATMNPFVNLSASVSQLAQALGTRMTSPDAVADLRAAAPAITDYTARVRYDDSVVNAQPTSQLQFTVDAIEPEVARRAVETLIRNAGTELHAMQAGAGVTDHTFAEVVELVPPTSPHPLPATALRSAVIWAVAGLLLGVAVLLVAGGFHRLIRRSPRQ